MPFVSKAQQRWMFAEKPEMAQEWADHTPDIKGLPERAKKEKKGLDTMNIIAQLGLAAREAPYIEKLARDAEISKELVYQFANMTGLSPIRFVKEAYADVDGFIDFLKVASGRTPLYMIKRAGRLLERLRGALDSIGRTAQRAYEGAIGKTVPTTVSGFGATQTLDMPKHTGGFLGTSPALNPPAKLLESYSPIGRSRAGRLVAGTAALGGAGYGTYRVGKALTGGGSEPEGADGVVEQSPIENATSGAETLPTGDGGQQGMSPIAKALLLGAGAAALGGGAYMAARKRKKKTKEAWDMYSTDFAKAAMCRAIEKKVEGLYRKEAADKLCKYLDKVAQYVSLEKQASLRTVQREVAAGKDLSVAIKLAYPHLSGEQRGILAQKLVKGAASGCGYGSKLVKMKEKGKHISREMQNIEPD